MGVWTYKQGAKASGASGTPTVTITGVTVGNLLVCNVVNFNANITSISDGSNTWTALTTGTFAAFWTPVTTGGSLSITAATAPDWAMSVAEFSPGGGTISSAGTAGTASGSSNAPAGGSRTVSTVPCLGIGFFKTGSVNSNTWSTSGNWVFDSNSGVNFASGTNFGSAISYWLAATPSPLTAAISLASSASWNGATAAFISTGGLTSSGSPLLMCM